MSEKRFHTLPNGQEALITDFQFMAAWAFFFAAAKKGRGAKFSQENEDLRCEELFAPLYCTAMTVLSPTQAHHVGEQDATHLPYLIMPQHNSGNRNEIPTTSALLSAARWAAHECPVWRKPSWRKEDKEAIVAQTAPLRKSGARVVPNSEETIFCPPAHCILLASDASGYNGEDIYLDPAEGSLRLYMWREEWSKDLQGYELNSRERVFDADCWYLDDGGSLVGCLKYVHPQDTSVCGKNPRLRTLASPQD